MAKQQNGSRITWEYCECGCHGHELKLGPAYYFMFHVLGMDKFFLNSQHNGYGRKLGVFDSFDAADKAARKLAKVALKKYREKLEKAEAGL